MSNLKLIAGTVKRRGIAIAAAVAVVGGSLATANYAMAVETEPTFDELKAEFSGTEAGNAAAKAADEFKKALGAGEDSEKLQQILEKGLEDAGFTEQDFNEYDQSKLKAELQDITNSAKQSFEKKNGSKTGQPAAPSAPTPQAPTQNPADWATPAPKDFYSPQRLEAEFGGTEEGKAAGETARIVADALRRGKPEAEIRQLIKDRLSGVGFTEDEISALTDDQLNDTFQQAKKKVQQPNLDLNEARAEALTRLQLLPNLNPLQREIFQKQIGAATSEKDVKIIFGAAEAEDKNPVAPFAPAPGQKAPEKSGDQTDTEKALAHTKEEALKKLEGFTFLTQQQKDAYTKAVNEATQVYQVEAAFETGEAKNKVNEEAKKAQGFLAKAIARTKHLALEKLDGFAHLTHEQKKDARKKILDAEQVYQVEAAFHAAEKLNKAAK